MTRTFCLNTAEAVDFSIPFVTLTVVTEYGSQYRRSSRL